MNRTLISMAIRHDCLGAVMDTAEADVESVAVMRVARKVLAWDVYMQIGAEMARRRLLSARG